MASKRVGREAEGRVGLAVREIPPTLAAAIAASGGASAANWSSIDDAVVELERQLP